MRCTACVDDTRRNFLITDAYHRLSTDMKRLIGPHGSWCTFSTWSSRTIGYFIRGDIDPVTEHWLAGLPAWIRFVVRRPVLHLNRLISRSRHRAGPRLLARGNREIFLEIAGEFARFIEAFATAPTRDDGHWRTYRATITASPASELFPAADIELMRNGFGVVLRRHPRDRRAEAGRAGAARQHPPRRLRAAASRPDRALGAQPVPEPAAERRPGRPRAAHRARQEAVGAARQGARAHVDRRDLLADRHDASGWRSSSRPADLCARTAS